MFKDRYHPAVKKDLKKLDTTARNDIKAEWIPKLLKKILTEERVCLDI